LAHLPDSSRTSHEVREGPEGDITRLTNILAYPVKQSVAANLVAIVGLREGWGPDFVRAAYRRWF
jgi:hypothetical protein